MLKWLTDNATAAREKLSSEVAKYKNADFRDAIVAGCALVAAADGDISAEEKQKMIGYMQSSDELKVFKMTDVMKSFNDVIGKFEFDKGIGQGEALKQIGKLKPKPEQAQLVVRVCCAIGAADGEFDEQERAAVRMICTELGLDAANFDL